MLSADDVGDEGGSRRVVEGKKRERTREREGKERNRCLDKGK
jgi:hypothetical protein